MHKFPTSLLVTLIFSLLPTSIYAWQATVMNVYDGDTVTVAPFGDETSPLFVLLYGIDAPDLQQKGGNESRLWLAEKLPEKSMIDIVTMGIDGYGRIYGLVAKNGRVLNGESIREGHSWVAASRCKAMVCRSWSQAQKAAKDSGKGLWKTQNPVAPWNWKQGGTSLPLLPDGQSLGVPGIIPDADPGLFKNNSRNEKTPPTWIPLN
ncbi:MAG: thermonuclease family protein [Desulfovibrio sp.]|nr:thermonuclease family protein [Desulfovibrio sp.]